MNTLMVIFTAVIAASTIVYTFMSYRQWKAIRFSNDLTRYTVAWNIFTQMYSAVEQAKRAGDPNAPMLERATNALAEAGIEQLMNDIDLKKNRKAIAYFSEMEGMIRANGLDPNNLWWFRPILKRLKE